MASLSARDFERSAGDLARKFRIVILYGDNIQAKSDLYRLLRKVLAIETDDPFRLAHLDSDTIDMDPARLADELGAISMFGGSRLIRAICSQRQSESIVQQALQAPPGDWHLLVETENLGVARSEVLKDDDLLLVACANERAGDFHSFVASEFKRADLQFDDGVLELLVPLLGDDRAAARGEVEKLGLLVGGSGRVSLADVDNVVADNSAVVTDAVAIAAFSGNLGALAAALDRLQATGSDATGALGAASRLALNLYRGKANQWRGRQDSVGQSLSAASLRGIALTLQSAIRQTRSNSQLAPLLSERALVSLGASTKVPKR